MPFVAIQEYFFYICINYESGMSVKRLISAFAAFCLLAGCEAVLSAESFQFSFPIGQFAVDTSYSYNIRAYARAREALESPVSGIITVTSYSSPDGKYSRNKQLAHLRADSVVDFLSANTNINASNILVKYVDEDWEGVKAYLKRSNKDWKQEALDILNAKSGDKKALLQDLWVGEAWDDLMKYCFPFLRRVTLEFTTSASEAVLRNSIGPEVVFSQGSSKVPASFYNELKHLASAGNSTLYIYIKASPEGTVDGNEALSKKRAARIEALLRQFGYSGEVSVQYRGEDWAGLLQVVKCAVDMPDQDSVINILQNQSLDRESRKKALQALSYGRTWLRLMDTEMSGLRKAIISTNVILD